jgi:hypothetical protein
LLFEARCFKKVESTTTTFTHTTRIVRHVLTHLHLSPANLNRVAREDTLAALVRSTSPALGAKDGDEALGPEEEGGRGAGVGGSAGGAGGTPQVVHATPRHRRVESLGGDVDITLSPGELGGSQYIMSPGDHLEQLQRTQSTMSDGRSAVAPPSSVEEVAAEQLRTSQRLFPIFVKGRKVVHLVGRLYKLNVQFTRSLKAPGFKTLETYKSENPVSKFAFKWVNLYRYTLVRHGQSTYNEAISGPGSWDEPNIFDAPLTKLGVNQAKSLGAFLSKLPKETVWVTSALTRAMETCVYGYKASLEVKQAQKRKGAAMREAAGGGGGGGGQPASGQPARRRSRLSHGGGGGPGGQGGSGAHGNGNGTAARASDENGYMEGTPMVGTTPGAGFTPLHGAGGGGDDAGGDGNFNFKGGAFGGYDSNCKGVASGSGAGGWFAAQQQNCDENTPAPGEARRLCLDVGGELAPEVPVGASPSEAPEVDGAEQGAWGDRVVVHQHLSEKLSTSGDIGRCKGVLMNEFPLLAGGLSRLPGDVWWYSQANRPNDAEREQFGSHEPSSKFKERVDRFRHWLMSREDKVFVVFGHSTFFKELTGGHRSLKNCEVHTYHL